MAKYLFLLFTFPAFAQAQTFTYTIDTIAVDSFFLNEVYKAAPTPENPRGQTTINSQLFRSEEQLGLFITNLKKQSDDYLGAAKVLALKSQAIGACLKKNEDFFKEPPENPKANKPKPKKEKQ